MSREELRKTLGPEYVSFKNGHAYIEGHKVLALANDLFGYDGWSSEVRNLTVDYIEEKNGRFSVGIHCISRVTLQNGQYREDVGYGSSINLPSRFQALEKAHKEASTDALKRALRQFGEALGNCLYSKEYVEVVRRMQFDRPVVDTENMLRPYKRPRGEPQEPKNTANASKVPKVEPAATAKENTPGQASDSSTPTGSAAAGKKWFGFDDDEDEVDADLPLPKFVSAAAAYLVNAEVEVPASALFDPSNSNIKGRSMKIVKPPSQL